METATSITRDEAIARIRAGLKKRSGKDWSVTGGRGTAWGWITICAPPRRCIWSHRLKPGMPDRPENYEPYDTGEPGRGMSPADRDELSALLGEKVFDQGASVMASHDGWREYIDRAEGRTPTKIAEPYWD